MLSQEFQSVIESAPSSQHEGKPGNNFAWRLCKTWMGKVLFWAEVFTAGRLWLLKSTLLCLAVTVIVSGGIGFKSLIDGYNQGYYDKIANPLVDVTKIHARGGHDEKLNFRLTVPTLLHLSGAHGRFILPALTILAIVTILVLSCLVPEQITRNRPVGLFIGLHVASTYIGSFGYLMCYDAIALAQVALACLPKLAWYWRGTLCFTAAFTDERGLLAALFVLAFLIPPQINRWRDLISKDILSVAAAFAAYAVLRLWLQFGLGLGYSLKAFGPGAFATNVKFWHPGTWFGLEGGWLPVLLALTCLFCKKQHLRLTIFFLPIGCLLLGAFMNGDVVRTTAYLFPAIFLALKVLREHDSIQHLKIFSLLAFIVSVVGGNYNVFLNEITWFMPLPVYLLHEGLNTLVPWAKALIGWTD